MEWEFSFGCWLASSPGFWPGSWFRAKIRWGFLGTLVLGLVGSLIGGFLGALIFVGEIDVNAAGIVGSVIGAVIALLVYRAMKGRTA